MSVSQKHKFCKYCGRHTLHQKTMLDNGTGCLLTVITAGLFIPIWLLLGVFDAFRPYRCQMCGKGRLT